MCKNVLLEYFVFSYTLAKVLKINRFIVLYSEQKFWTHDFTSIRRLVEVKIDIGICIRLWTIKRRSSLSYLVLLYLPQLLCLAKLFLKKKETNNRTVLNKMIEKPFEAFNAGRQITIPALYFPVKEESSNTFKNFPSFIHKEI